MEKTRLSELLWRSQKNSPIIHLWRYRRRGCIAPTQCRPRHEIWVSGQGHVPAALCPGEKTPGTHCTGGWEGPRAGMDTEARGKISYPCRGSNIDCPVVQSVARHYTDWGPAPSCREFFFWKRRLGWRRIRWEDRTSYVLSRLGGFLPAGFKLRILLTHILSSIRHTQNTAT
jgi:hypothetical protein